MTARPALRGLLDLFRGVVRVTAGFISIVLLMLGTVWLFDGGTERWPSYLGIAALAFAPGYLLLSIWWQMILGAVRRHAPGEESASLASSRYRWRLEAAAMAVVLSLGAVGAAAGAVVRAVEAVRRIGWEQVEATGVERISLREYRYTLADGTAITFSGPAKPWPPPERVASATLVVYVDPDDPERGAAESPAELGLVAALGAVVAALFAAGARTVGREVN